MREINKKPFSVGLYIEGLRQLRIVGILGAILLFCSSAIITISNALSTQRQMELYQDSSIVLASLSALEVAPLLLLLFSVFAPVMTLWLFHFMNKRNSSDFLFAIPQTRMALYCSYTSSIVTWLAILALSGLIGVLIPAAIFSTYINIPYHALFLLTLSCFLYSLQVMAAILVAVSISGTVFSNIILSGLILFAPRLLIFMLTDIWKNIPFIYASSDHFSLLNDFINPISGCVLYLLNGILDTYQLFSSAAPMIYSVCLSVIYLLLAAFLFQKRKSETAGKSASSPILQSIYRITVTMIYCIVVVAAVILSEANVMQDATCRFEIIVAYLVAVAIYFLFELLTTKSVQKMWKAAPGLLVVLVLNGVMIFGMHSIIQRAYNFQPTAEEVTGITFLPQSTNNGNQVSYDDYVQSHYMGTITDKDLIAAILDNLKSDVQDMKEGGSQQYYNDEKRYAYAEFNFKIITKSGTRYRHIRIDPKTQRALAEQTYESMKDDSSWRNPPEPIEQTLWTYDRNGSYGGMNERDASQLFETLKTELQTVDFSAWYTANYSTETAVFWFDYDIYDNNSNYQISIPVYASIYPKTVEQYQTYLYEQQQEDLSKLKDFVKNDMPKLQFAEDYDISLSIHISGETAIEYPYSNPENTNLLSEILEKGLLDHPITDTDSYVELDVDVYDDEYTNIYDDDRDFYGGNFCIAADTDFLKSLLQPSSK